MALHRVTRHRYGMAVLLILSCTLVRPAWPLAQAPTFRSRIDSVRLDALITLSGQAVTGLSARDFEVFDNNVKQSVDYVGLDELPVNVVHTLDMSESVSGNVLQHLRTAITGVLSGLRVGDQTALVTFNHRVALALPLSADFMRVGPAVSTIRPTGGTALIDAAYSALWVAESDPGRTVVILFSDGLDTASWLSRDRVIEAAKRVDATIYAVTSGAKRNPFVSELVEASGGRVFDAASPEQIGPAFEAILREFRQRYVISYSPLNVSPSGWHRVELRVKGKNPVIRVRSGYLAGPD